MSAARFAPWMPGAPDRDALMDETVADALQAISRQIDAGLPLETMVPFDTDTMKTTYAYRTTYKDVYLSVFHEVRTVLVQHRDYGTVADRVRNRQGNVPWPARQLPAGTTPGSHDSSCDPRPEY